MLFRGVPGPKHADQTVSLYVPELRKIRVVAERPRLTMQQGPTRHGPAHRDQVTVHARLSCVLTPVRATPDRTRHAHVLLCGFYPQCCPPEPAECSQDSVP